MPLLKGSPKKVVSQNISEFHGGKTYAHTAAKFGKKRADAQAVAVAMATARRYGKKYAEGGDVDPYETKLSSRDEGRFAEWKRRNAPKDSGADYDLRGAFKAGLTPAANGHWPDTFKKPNHPTFSDQSIYAKQQPELAGSWNGETFIPPAMYAEGGDVDPFSSAPLPEPPPRFPQRTRKATPIDDDYVQELSKNLEGDNPISTGLREGVKGFVEYPGKRRQAKPEDQSGPMTEEEAFRINMARQQDANWGAGTALGMVGMGRLPGAAPEGAVGIGGGNLHPPERAPQPIPQPKYGTPEFEEQLFGHLSNAMAGKNAAPELNPQLEQLYHAITGKEIPKDSPIAPAPKADPYEQVPYKDEAGIPVHKTIADTMVADLVDGTKPKDVAKYLFEYAKQDPEGALAAKNILPKQAKSDINKALWSLTKDKSFSPEDKEIINNLYSSKAKAKKVEPEPAPERGNTEGVTPDEIDEFFKSQEAHEAGPQWEPPMTKAKHPAYPGDPEIGITNDLFEQHNDPFPRQLTPMPEDKVAAAREWGLTQPAYHGTPKGGFPEFRLPEEIPITSDYLGKDSHMYRDPELGIHSGTLMAAHHRIGPYNPKSWESAELHHKWDSENAYSIIPLVIKADRPLDLPDLGTWGPNKVAQALRAHSPIPHEDIADAMRNHYPANSRARDVAQMASLRKLLDNHGYDSVRYINNVEDPGSVSFITWHKNQMRVPWAAFRDKSSASLTAGIAGGGVLYPYYRNNPASDEGNGMNKGGRTPMAAGGFNASKWIPRPPNLMGGIRPVGGGMPRAIAPKASPGLIHSTIPGRTDKIPRSVPGGSYIIPASVVSGMGQGNTLAGADALNKLFAQGPYGDKMQKFGTPKPNFGHPMHMATPQMRMPKPAKAGGVEEGSDHVPIIVAGGEYQVPPEVVQRIGNGNMKQGHRILDELVMHIRRQTIKDMRKEKKPKGSGG